MAANLTTLPLFAVANAPATPPGDAEMKVIPSLWDDADVIYAYSRAQALEDGVLVDVSDTAREAGFKWPVALTSAVWGLIEDIPSSKSWQSVAGRLWDVLYMAFCAIKCAPRGGDTLHYRLIMHHGRHTYVTLKLVTSPGDAGEPAGEPVVTIMLPEED